MVYQTLLMRQYDVIQDLPYIVILAEDHASFAVAGATILAQLSMAA